jgi:hypothetical protein
MRNRIPNTINADDPAVLGRLLRSWCGGIKSFVSTRTKVALETVKVAGVLPVQGLSILRGGGRRG